MGLQFDTVIIGAGIAGLAVGWRCQQRGISTAIIDRERPGAGASGVAAGMLAPVTEATFGEETLLRLNLESARRFPSFIAELEEISQERFDQAAAGTIYTATDRDQLEALERLFEFQTSLGLEVRWLDHTEVRGLEPALHPSTRAGIIAEEDKEVDPRKLTNALTKAFEVAGGTSFFATSVVRMGARPNLGVVLESGDLIRAKSVVVAAGAWSSEIEGVPREIREGIRPVKGQVVRTMTPPNEPPITQHVIRTEEVYLVPRRNGELVIGATVEEKGFDQTVSAGGVFDLLRSALETLPGVRDFEVTEVASGLRPATRDNLPLLGPTSLPGVVAATGHFRNGVLLAPLTGDAISAFVSNGEVVGEIEPFLPTRFS